MSLYHSDNVPSNGDVAHVEDLAWRVAKSDQHILSGDPRRAGPKVRIILFIGIPFIMCMYVECVTFEWQAEQEAIAYHNRLHEHYHKAAAEYARDFPNHPLSFSRYPPGGVGLCCLQVIN